jgi:hypothetical protein
MDVLADGCQSGRVRVVWGDVRACFVVSLIALLVAALPAGTASAKTGKAPPGQSGVDEYVESLPSSDGSTGSDTGSGGGSRRGLSPAAARRLAQQGPDGKAVAALTAATGSAPRHRPAEPGGAADRDVASGGDQGFISGIASALTGGSSGGMGIALPIILGVTLLGAAVIGVVRFRAGRGGGPAPPQP